MTERPEEERSVHSESARRLARVVLWSFAVLPLLWVSSIYTFVLRWHSFYRAWPDTGHVRASLAGALTAHESLTGLLSYFALFSFPVWLIFVLYLYHFVLPAARFGLAFIPWALVLILVMIDPGHYVTWFFD